MSEYQYAKRETRPEELKYGGTKKRYVFECNGCGTEIKGYMVSKVRGKIWCNKCYVERRDKKAEYIKRKRVCTDLEGRFKSLKLPEIAQVLEVLHSYVEESAI